MTESGLKDNEFEAIAQKVVNSVLDSDHETSVSTPSQSRRSSKSCHSFADGLSFLKAITTLREKTSHEKNSPKQDLNQRWQIWYWRRSGRQRHADWHEFLQKKNSFSTKEEFWSVIDEINGENIEYLSDHFDCYVFKEGIKPMWEDLDNKDGGRWIIQINREHSWKHLVNLEEIWLKVVLLVTGFGEEVPDFLDQICGCVLMVRHEMIKIAIWTKKANDTLGNLSICHFLKTHTGFGGVMWYERHCTSGTGRHSKIRFSLPKNLNLTN